MAPNTDIATRALVVTLKSPSGGKTTNQVVAITSLNRRLVDKIYARACERGFDPNAIPLIIKDEYLQDAPRSGRPVKQGDVLSQAVIKKVRYDRYGREKACTDLAGELSQELGIDVSASTIHRCLKTYGFKKSKPTRKPGLTKKMRAERLQWCLDHQDWTLEDWKNVIWSDETSVVIGHRRGGYKVWRTADEAFAKSCIRERWKGYQEFMFWGCFTYDKKGPSHCWLPETAKEKAESEKVLELLNGGLEAEYREEWELLNGLGRLGLENRRGRKPKWAWNAKNGKLVRRKGNGVDWYRYQTKVLIPKLIPFAKECLKDRPQTVIQEDLAPSHAHHAQERVYSLYQVTRLLWCPNSPDLNAIEPCWYWMKRNTTKKGAPSNRADAIRKWEACWNELLPQEKIQAWIERIPRHIKEIIRLEGGNEYKEGREHLQREH
jgi:hypothetical protein